MYPQRSIMPQMPAEAYKTYQVARPLATHWRRAACSEVGCDAHLYGWAITLAITDEKNLAAIRASKRKHTTEPQPGGFVRLVFEAGQECFASSRHRLPLDRAEIYVVRQGDFRGNPRGEEPRVHAYAQDWVEDFGEHQQGIADAISRG